VKLLLALLFTVSVSAHEYPWHFELTYSGINDFSKELTSSLTPKYLCLTNENPEKSIFSRYPEEIAKIRELLKADDTNTVRYELKKFSCHNFSKRVYLQNSSLVNNLEDYHIEDLEKEWGVPIVRDESKEKVPMHYITLSSKEEGYFHAINAVLLDKENPGDIDSYVFIEPQTDVLYSASELKSFSERLMKKKFNHSVEVGIGTFDSFKHNGNIWQSHSSYSHKMIID